MQSQKKQQQKQAAPVPQKQDATPTNANQPPVQEPTRDRGKKRAKPSDEIEELFEKSLGKKVRKAALGEGEKPRPVAKEEGDEERKKSKKGKRDKDRELDSVMGAIKSAPKHEDGGRPKKKHKRV